MVLGSKGADIIGIIRGAGQWRQDIGKTKDTKDNNTSLMGHAKVVFKKPNGSVLFI